MYIRRHLILKGMTKPNKLHQEATKYVSAKAQAHLIALMLEEQVLTEKEEEIYKRGRNTNSHTKAKNADVVTYRMSTGFEAIMGYLHLTENIERLDTLISWCIQKWRSKNACKRITRLVSWKLRFQISRLRNQAISLSL